MLALGNLSIGKSSLREPKQFNGSDISRAAADATNCAAY
jgi:hypothetical protein